MYEPVLKFYLLMIFQKAQTKMCGLVALNGKEKNFWEIEIIVP
jgi:hypothetical protein